MRCLLELFERDFVFELILEYFIVQFLQRFYKRNSIVVTEEKPFKCPNCNKSFAENYKLENHVAFVHEEKKSVDCPVCDITFKKCNSLNKHIATEHLGEEAQNFLENDEVSEEFQEMEEGDYEYDYYDNDEVHDTLENNDEYLDLDPGDSFANGKLTALKFVPSSTSKTLK